MDGAIFLYNFPCEEAKEMDGYDNEIILDDDLFIQDGEEPTDSDR